jgi:hypothetical protein
MQQIVEDWMPIGKDHHIASNKLLKIGCQLEMIITLQATNC